MPRTPFSRSEDSSESAASTRLNDAESDKQNLDSSETAKRIRLRDNQRRSRARRREYLKELETKSRNQEMAGIQASREIQEAARKVLNENRKLRLLLATKGVTNDEIDNWVPLMDSGGSTIPAANTLDEGSHGAVDDLDWLLNGQNSRAGKVQMPTTTPSTGQAALSNQEIPTEQYYLQPQPGQEEFTSQSAALYPQTSYPVYPQGPYQQLAPRKHVSGPASQISSTTTLSYSVSPIISPTNFLSISPSPAVVLQNSENTYEQSSAEPDKRFQEPQGDPMSYISDVDLIESELGSPGYGYESGPLIDDELLWSILD